MEVIDFMCDGVCVCGDCMSVHLKGLWSVAIWWREKGERVYICFSKCHLHSPWIHWGTYFQVLTPPASRGLSCIGAS